MADADGELRRLRYPPDGDVERWVRDGPPGHVEYHGGPVEWEPAPRGVGSGCPDDDQQQSGDTQ